MSQNKYATVLREVRQKEIRRRQSETDSRVVAVPAKKDYASFLRALPTTLPDDVVERASVITALFLALSIALVVVIAVSFYAVPQKIHDSFIISPWLLEWLMPRV